MLCYLAHGITALVEMRSELEAKKAFEALAYANKVTKNQPLYLEWAPMDVFDEAHPRRKQDKSQHKEGRHDHEDQSHQSEILPDKEEENADGTVEDCGKKEPEITKILVRNVPFQVKF
jgi:multiple RNA-binding domain-containing protein 1